MSPSASRTTCPALRSIAGKTVIIATKKSVRPERSRGTQALHNVSRLRSTRTGTEGRASRSPFQEPLQEAQTIGLALLGMELHPDDIAAADRSGDRPAMVTGREPVGGVGHVEHIAVQIIGLARHDQRMI